MTESEGNINDALGWAHERLQQILDKRGAGVDLDETDIEFLSLINRTENHFKTLGIDLTGNFPDSTE